VLEGHVSLFVALISCDVNTGLLQSTLSPHGQSEINNQAFPAINYQPNPFATLGFSYV